MKTRESGMPEEARWETFFDPDFILTEFGLDKTWQAVVDMGCGYGTFSIPAARRIGGMVHAIDIDPQMVKACQAKAKESGVTNIDCVERDFVTYGTCQPDDIVDFVMLFNILHAVHPVRLLDEAYRVLKPGGKVGVIHWNYDPTTPRGPSMEIRPRPEQCQNWIWAAGFQLIRPLINLPPYHYGMIGQKQEAERITSWEGRSYQYFRWFQKRMTEQTRLPIHTQKYYDDPSVFTPENLLPEARR